MPGHADGGPLPHFTVDGIVGSTTWAALGYVVPTA
jgi:hypothetical protein